MKITSIQYNKITTAITEENGKATVKTFKTRKSFWNWLATVECFSMVISVGKAQVIAKIKEMGFDCIEDHSYGMYESECKVICTN